MSQTIGFVGYGHINSGIARLAVDAGYNVVISNSRGPETLADAVAELGPRARAATAAEAAQAGDIVSVSVNLFQVDTLPADALDGKIVIDSMNYYPQRDERIPDIDERKLTVSQYTLGHIPGARLVKALHNLDLFHLRNGARPKGSPERWALPIAANDDEAKTAVAEFMDKIGFDPVDCGTLADSWRIQGGTPVYVLPYIGEFPEGLTFEERQQWFRTEHTATVTPDDVRRLVAEAKWEERAFGLIEDLPKEFTS
ncbi:NADPH-dependent F420 reductase [Streptomyces sp. NPDC090088]|uniref:NADPH-dependent F420 reductase n=1 Tax=Streptomyces sp. NPDC090088 TaxID=3365944 RepID=UPI00382FB7EC